MNSVRFWAKQFCLNTNLHGYKFIALPDRAPLERFLWTTIVAFFWSSALMILLHTKDRSTRITTTFVTDTINCPIWNFPFPAVTICSFNKISKQRALLQAQLLENKLNFTVEEIANSFTLLSQLYFGSDNIEQTYPKRYSGIMQLLDYNKININKLLRSVSPSCGSILTKCKWKGEDKNCDMLFEKVITSEGHCCAFNYYAPKNHTFGGLLYPVRAPSNPRKVSSCGSNSALEALVDTNHSDYFSSDTLGFGSKIMIHNSYDYPDWSDQSHLLGTKVMSFLGLNPTLTLSSADLRALSVRERSCFFEEEFPLLNFRHYTYQNCLTECRMNLTWSYCGCIPVIYVNEDGRVPVNYKVCSVRDVGCLNRYKPYIRSTVPGIDIEGENSTDYVWNQQNPPCNCLPECSSTSYKFQTSSTFLDPKHTPWVVKSGLYHGVDLMNHSVVRIYFNDLVGTRNRRKVNGNWRSFLAFYGGVLGLFVGFSFIAAIEFIYFFTVKIFIDYSKQSKVKQKKGKVIKQFLRGNGNLGKSTLTLQVTKHFDSGKHMKKPSYQGVYLE